MNPAAYVVTCPERSELLATTLASFRASDWGAEPLLQVDDASSNTSRAGRLNGNWFRTLKRVAAGAEPFALILEDDVKVNTHLRHNLERWAPLTAARTGLFFGTLYNAAQTLNPHAMWGSQGIVLSRPMASYLASNWCDEDGLCDTRMPRLASRITTIHVHTPSLVQHIGRASTWGGRFHQAPDFDPTWRALSLWPARRSM